jgi:hypothetical protein
MEGQRFEREGMMSDHQRAMDIMGMADDGDEPAAGAPEEGEPQVDKLGEMIAQMQQSNAMMMQMLQQAQAATAQQNQMLVEQLSALAKASSAPVVFDRDPTGRITGGRKDIK